MPKRIRPFGISLLAPWLALSAAAAGTVRSVTPVQGRERAMQLVDEMKANLESLERSHQAVQQAAERISEMYARLAAQANRVAKLSASRANSTSDLLRATKEMQETQMSFSLQYLQLQSQMQNANRQFTAVSNIMKAKHDTVKNSISNIR